MGCTTAIVPPQTPREPATVFLLDFGRTPGLVLPAPDGMILYVYGDWDWYALGNTGFQSGLAAMGWPTQGALGRQALERPATAQSIRQQLQFRIEQIHAIEVENAGVERLRTGNERLWLDWRDSAVTRPGSNMVFVPHPANYHYLHNSNHMTANWLRALGCEVRGPAFYSRWAVAEPRTP